MTDVLKIALSRRDELNGEIRELDDFIRMAERLIGQDRDARAAPRVDPVQARFNSGEVLPPASGDRDTTGSSADSERTGVFRRGAANVA